MTDGPHTEWINQRARLWLRDNVPPTPRRSHALSEGLLEPADRIEQRIYRSGE